MRFRALLVCIPLLAGLVRCAPASTGCVDYAGYLHWEGGVATPGRAYAVAVAGSHAFVADSSAGLEVVDIANPAQPSITAGVPTPGNALGVAVAGAGFGPVVFALAVTAAAAYGALAVRHGQRGDWIGFGVASRAAARNLRPSARPSI